MAINYFNMHPRHLFNFEVLSWDAQKKEVLISKDGELLI